MAGMTVEGMEQVDGRLQTIESAERHLVAPMEASVDGLAVRVEANTPVDSGRLVGGLDKLVRTHSRGVTGAVYYNPAVNEYGHRYDQYVKGPEDQAYMHRNRGVTTIEDDFEAERDVIEGRMAGAVEGMVNGAG